MHVEAMSTPPSSPAEPVRSSLVRRIFFLTVVICALAIGLSVFTGRIQTASLSLQVILADAVCGLVAGLSSRWVFHRRTRLLQFTAGVAGLLGCQLMLGLLTRGQIGVGPLVIGRRTVDWNGLGQLFLGSGITLLALQAWHREAPPSAPPPQERQAKRRSARKKPVRRRTQGVPRQPKLGELPASAPVATAPKRRRVLRRKAHVQLSGEVEHRCPYCLELVEPDDPRGIVECKVCHTLHHADCWAITGACQVPHYNS
jgi:hypothetical protein